MKDIKLNMYMSNQDFIDGTITCELIYKTDNMIKISDFPKTERKLQAFLRRNLEAFQKNIMKEAPKDILEVPGIEEGWVKKYSEVVVETEPRTFTDFLDEEGVIIGTDYNTHNMGFTCNIVGTLFSSHIYRNRIEAEREAFEEAIKILEGRL